jgi:hypothetical protein
MEFRRIAIKFILGTVLFLSLLAFTPPRVQQRIQVILGSGVDYAAAFQALDAKSEIELISWNAQTGVAELAVDPRVTNAILEESLALYQVKVISIVPIQP